MNIIKEDMKKVIDEGRLLIAIFMNDDGDLAINCGGTPDMKLVEILEHVTKSLKTAIQLMQARNN